MSARQKIRIVAVGVGVVVSIAALRAWYVQKHRMTAEEGIRKMWRDMDENAAQSGLVKVGENTWELPRKDATNLPTGRLTNTMETQ